MATELKRMRQIIGTAADWAANDLVIGDGELALLRDGEVVTFKVGNGVLRFSELPFAVAGGGSGGGSDAQSHAVLVQRRANELFCGFNDGTTDTQIFPNAANASQGLAYVKVGGIEWLYLLQTTSGSTAKADERKRIVEYQLTDDGGVIGHTVFTGELNLGHQGLSALMEGGVLKLYGQIPVVVGHEGTDVGKGYAVTTWKGAATAQADVRSYQLWGYVGSGHRFASYTGATVAVSTDGRFVVLVATDATEVAGDPEDTINIAFVYDRLQVEAAADPLTVNPLYCVPLVPPDSSRNNYNQGVACDGQFIYMTRGYYSPLLQHTIQKFDFYGNLVTEIQTDDVRSEYGIDLILNHPTLGSPISFEPEGIALRDDGEVLVLSMDNWRTGGAIVSYLGRNWVSIASPNVNHSPENELYWIRTTKAATAGAWNTTTDYGTGTSSRRSKVVYSIRAPRGVVGEKGTSAGITAKQSGASLNSRANAVDVAFRYGDSFQIAGFSENTETFYNGLQYASQNALRLFDQRPGSDNTKYSYTDVSFGGGREQVQLRSRDSGLVNGAGITMYGIGDSTSPGKLVLVSRNDSTATSWEVHLDTVGTVRPGVPDAQDIGTQSAFRWKRGFFNQVYVGASGSSVSILSGAGTPEGAVTAAVGSLFLRSDGVAGTRLYWKNTGTGTTGWVAII